MLIEYVNNVHAFFHLPIAHYASQRHTHLQPLGLNIEISNETRLDKAKLPHKPYPNRRLLRMCSPKAAFVSVSGLPLYSPH
jgi:hypothetical protein